MMAGREDSTPATVARWLQDAAATRTSTSSGGCPLGPIATWESLAIPALIGDNPRLLAPESHRV